MTVVATTLGPPVVFLPSFLLPLTGFQDSMGVKGL